MARFRDKDYGTCLFHDGVDDISTIPYHASQDLADNISIAAWINPLSFGENNLGAIIGKGVAGFSTGYGFQLSNNTGAKTIRLAANNTSHLANSNIITLGLWQHIGVTYDKNAGSDQIKFYVNGVAAGVATKSNSMTTNASDLTIGNTSSRAFSGLMDELKLYGRTITAAEMLQEYLGANQSITNLIGYWKMDEGSGTSLVDSSGNQSAGTISGSIYSTLVVRKPRTKIT